MTDENEPKKSIFDVTGYSEKTRKIIFGIVVAVLLAIVGIAMFFISPRNDSNIEAPVEPSTSPTATQAAVDNEGSTIREEATTPSEDLPLQNADGSFPKDEQDEAAKAQQKIIEESLKREKEQTDKVIEDSHADIADAENLKAIASKGMLEYCIDNANETKEQKQARMKPYFHTSNTEYNSPQSLYFLKKCSVEGVTEPAHNDKEEVVVNVGVAWGAQLKAEGAADTGYTQYSVIVDKDGIVSFDD